MQPLERFRALSTRHQVTLIASLFAVCSALVVAIWYLFLGTPYQTLFTDLRPADAATIISELEHKKVPYRLSNGGTTIAVPADRVDVTRLNIMTEDLPLKGTVGFEIFNKSDMGLTDFAQKINYQRALQGELERTIMSLDGVASARVHISLGEDRIFRDDQVPPKASVTVRMARGLSLDGKAVQGIQRLVAAAIPKLDSGDVVVLDEEGRVVSALAEPTTAKVEQLAIDEQHAIEAYYAARVRELLQRPPYLRYAIEVAVAAPEGTQRRDAQGFVVWNAAARDFPLTVTLSSYAVIPSDMTEQLQGLVSTAVGPNATGRDTIRFERTGQAPAVEPAIEKAAAPLRSARPLITPEVPATWNVFEILFVAIPVLALIGFAIAFATVRKPRRLSEEQRATFAKKLAEAAQGVQSHVAS